jgi:pimeloyl-ACP methyl ester carboxylesterase
MASIPIRNERIRGDGLDLHVTIAGEGPPVILLHGFPENAHSWQRQIAPLAATGFSAWVPNLRGYPPSEIPTQRGACHLRHLVRDVAAIVGATGYPRAHVVGHDWGGIIAWTFAGTHPALLDKLVIMNAPHMQIYAEKVWRTSQLLRSWYVALFQLPLLPERALAAGRYRALKAMFAHLPARKGTFDERDIAGYVDTLSHPGALKAALDYYRENMRSDGMALARSARTDADTLVIWGLRDPALGPFLLDGLERFAPRVRIHRIDRASHWVQNEAPDEVNREMLRFLAQDKTP